MTSRSSSPQLCAELLAHPSMNSPIVVFLLGSPNYFPGSKNRFEAVRVRSRGGNLTSVGNVFGVGKNRANQLVFHGIAELRRLIEFDLQFRKHGDLAGPLDSHCKWTPIVVKPPRHYNVGPTGR